MQNFVMTAFVGTIVSSTELRSSKEHPAEVTLAEVNAQVEAGCPGASSGCGCHSHCGGCCHNHCNNCCDSDDDSTDTECDLSTRNCNTPPLCYDTVGWSVPDVLAKHDLD